jgi:hypothetical protein
MSVQSFPTREQFQLDWGGGMFRSTYKSLSVRGPLALCAWRQVDLAGAAVINGRGATEPQLITIIGTITIYVLLSPAATAHPQLAVSELQASPHSGTRGDWPEREKWVVVRDTTGGGGDRIYHRF